MIVGIKSDNVAAIRPFYYQGLFINITSMFLLGFRNLFLFNFNIYIKTFLLTSLLYFFFYPSFTIFFTTTDERTFKDLIYIYYFSYLSFFWFFYISKTYERVMFTYNFMFFTAFIGCLFGNILDYMVIEINPSIIFVKQSWLSGARHSFFSTTTNFAVVLSFSILCMIYKKNYVLRLFKNINYLYYPTLIFLIYNLILTRSRASMVAVIIVIIVERFLSLNTVNKIFLSMFFLIITLTLFIIAKQENSIIFQFFPELYLEWDKNRIWMWKQQLINFEISFFGLGYRHETQIFNQVLDGFINHGILSGVFLILFILTISIKILLELINQRKKLEACFTLYGLLLLNFHVFFLTKLFDFYTFLLIITTMFLFFKKREYNNLNHRKV